MKKQLIFGALFLSLSASAIAQIKKETGSNQAYQYQNSVYAGIFNNPTGSPLYANAIDLNDNDQSLVKITNLSATSEYPCSICNQQEVSDLNACRSAYKTRRAACIGNIFQVAQCISNAGNIELVCTAAAELAYATCKANCQ